MMRVIVEHGDAAGDPAQLLAAAHAREARDATLDVFDGHSSRERDRNRGETVADVVTADEQRLEALDPIAVVIDVERDASGLADLEVARPPRDVGRDPAVRILTIGAFATDDGVELDLAVRALGDRADVGRVRVRDEQATLLRR